MTAVRREGGGPTRLGRSVGAPLLLKEEHKAPWRVLPLWRRCSWQRCQQRGWEKIHLWVLTGQQKGSQYLALARTRGRKWEYSSTFSCTGEVAFCLVLCYLPERVWTRREILQEERELDPLPTQTNAQDFHKLWKGASLHWLLIDQALHQTGGKYQKVHFHKLCESLDAVLLLVLSPFQTTWSSISGSIL